MAEIRALLVGPGEKPRLVTVEHTLENLQKLVGGYIQAVYDKAKDECWLNNYEAICPEHFLPDVENRLLIALHKDGRVDTGSEKNVIMRLDR